MRKGAVWVIANLLLACEPSAEPRAQLVVVVDSDAPVTSQIRLDPAVSAAAAIDTLLVERVEPDGTLVLLRRLVIPDASSWPVSFGIATPVGAGSGGILLRLRAHSGGMVVSRGGEPTSELTIDRLAELEFPEDGIVSVGILLSFDCFGRPATLSPPSSCVAGDSLEASPRVGIEVLGTAGVVTRVGTAPSIRELPCTGTAPKPHATCIPGGFSVRGDLRIPDVHLQPMLVKPFFIDRTEFSVARFRPLRSLLQGAQPFEQDPFGPCALAANDDSLPLNCVVWSTADELCRLDGGKLPTAGQWEHAARGRGQGRRFPWGDGLDGCGVGGCGDVSRDGVLALGGSAAEMVADSYPESCVQPGIVEDPLCIVEGVSERSARGGWEATLRESTYPLPAFPAAHVGFRCAYPDGT